MKTKRLLALLLTSAMTASMILAGCGGGSSETSSGSGSTGSDSTGAESSAEGTTEGVSTQIDMTQRSTVL